MALGDVHGGEYTVELWQGPAGQPSCGGGELIGTLSIHGHSQGDFAANMTVQEQDSGVDYSWRVSATDVASCYPFPEPLPFSNCAIFHIAKPPPPTVTAPEVPQTLPRFGGNIGLMAMIFQFVPDANHYQFEVNAGDIQDEAAIGALLGTFDFTADQIASYDATIAQQGLALPVPWHIVLINHVQPAQAYQWRVAACAIRRAASGRRQLFRRVSAVAVLSASVDTSKTRIPDRRECDG